MNAKDKAEELFNKYLDETTLYPSGAKKCALIAVDEIQEAIRYLDDDSEDYWYDNYWQEVKNEIEKL